MTGKMKNLIEYLLGGCPGQNLPQVIWNQDGEMFVTDGQALLQISEKLDGIPEKTGFCAERCAETMGRGIAEAEMCAHDLLTAAEIKEGIRSVRGRKYSIPVVCKLTETMPAVNADYLLRGMEALNARRLFFVDGKQASPVLIFRDDEPWSQEVMLILPVVGNGVRTGFWQPPVGK